LLQALRKLSSIQQQQLIPRPQGHTTPVVCLLPLLCHTLAPALQVCSQLQRLSCCCVQCCWLSCSLALC
jgi:hypothetical protein